LSCIGSPKIIESFYIRFHLSNFIFLKTTIRLLHLIRLMNMERIQTEVVRMIENPSWQNNEGNLPIMSNDKFNSFLRNHMNNSNLSDTACKQIKKQLVSLKLSFLQRMKMT
jgi:hypothetical protein